MKGDFNALHSCISFISPQQLYFVFQFSNDGHKVNHQLLSTCSKVSYLKKILLKVMSFPKELVTMNLGTKTRTTCLTDKRSPVCGDGMVEGREECDCGTVFLCTATRSSEQLILAQYRE